jgi:predicted transcriptional regulator
MRQNFHRHIAIEARIAGAVHLAHAAGADDGDDFIWAQAGSGGKHQEEYLYRTRGGEGKQLLRASVSHNLKTMEVHFTPEQEAQLSQIATKAGIDLERLVKDAALRLLEEDARYRAAVREGIEQANRVEFFEESEMDARLEQMLRL